MEKIHKSKHANGLYDDKVAKKLTICEVHRRLYKSLKNTDYMTDEIRFLLEQGFVIGKKMHYRLRKYKEGWTEDVYQEQVSNDLDKITQDKPIEWEWLSK